MYLLRFALIFFQLTTQSPVDQLKEQVAQVLKGANVPFTGDQEKQLALLIEDQRQASENLFGVIWDFSKGPPQGEQRDQALAGIQWMHDEFKKKLPSYLTDAQRAAWEKFESGGATIGARIESTSGAQTAKIQQIRVTNNAFNAEVADVSGQNGLSGGGARTEVIENGGIGAFHGNFSSTFQDQRFNARNPFATNKPPYYERTILGNVSGPIIRNRLTLNFTVNDNKQENAATVKAQRVDGPFSLGVTKPVLNRSYDVKSIFQLSSTHSVNVGFQYATKDSRNENIGDFSLPERASRTQTRNHTIDVREISILSERTVHDLRFVWKKAHSDRNPSSNALAIIVKDAFTAGGSQNKNLTNGNTWELSNLLYFAGEKLTLRTGFQGAYRRDRSISEDNFFGEFTFSDLDSYVAGKPIKYRITCCDPNFEMSQGRFALFSQNDLKLTRTFTLMIGTRYQYQSDLRDRNNIDPRIGFAYAIGNTTVVRGGVGIFHGEKDFNQVVNYRRIDGSRLYEIQIDNPGWPNPLAGGNIRPRSRRMGDPAMEAESYYPVQIALERSLPKNLFVTVSYQRIRGTKLARGRDLNAPLPGSVERINPAEGQVAYFEHSGMSTHHHLKASMRQRFSIFNVTANYSYYTGWNDSSTGGFNALPTDSHDRMQDWGYAGGEHHTFNTSINSRLPLDVYLTTNITAKSGEAYSITTGKDDNKDGVINDRPNGLAKNSEFGPHYFDVSFNFSKAFQLSRGGVPARGNTAASGPQVNIFANLNNALNMTHPGTPSGVMTSPFFMRSYNASSPREIEVGMRFQF